MSLDRAAVRARDVVLGYGSTVALTESTFEIEKGEITAIIGPNGAGKSTVLNAIAGLAQPIAGSIEVYTTGRDTQRIAYVFQTTKVNESLPISVYEVVAMGRYASLGPRRRLKREDRAAIKTAIERTGITDLAGKHLHELSGGQRQRVFVAQGLAQEHDILMLDEPLTGLDLPTAQAIDDVIHDESSRGCAVIITTHDLSEARVADHVLLLSGRVVASGSPDEVLTAENLASAYGEALLHLEEGRVFIDDPAHVPVPGRHVHRERTIHTEGSPSDLHGE